MFTYATSRTNIIRTCFEGPRISAYRYKLPDHASRRWSELEMNCKVPGTDGKRRTIIQGLVNQSTPLVRTRYHPAAESREQRRSSLKIRPPEEMLLSSNLDSTVSHQTD